MKTKIRAYFLKHSQVCIASLGLVWRTPLASIMTILVIGFMMSLPVGIFVLLQNTEQFGQHWKIGTQINLFLEQGVTSQQVENLKQELQQQPNIEQLRILSPTEGLAEFEQHSAFSNVLSILQENPLPYVIEVFPSANLHSIEAVKELSQLLEKKPLVENVQVDMIWIQRLFAIITLLRDVVLAMGVLLSMTILIVIGNTIRLSLQYAHKEIDVIRLVGGTRAFIRRPYLYVGIWYGLLGGFITCLLIWITYGWLHSSFNTVIIQYDSQFRFVGFSLLSAMTLLIINATIGFIAAYSVVEYHLRKKY